MFSEQTYANKSRHFSLKHFCISPDANEIVLHVIKQCMQAVIIHAVTGTQATLKRHSNHQSTD